MLINKRGCETTENMNKTEMMNQNPNMMNQNSQMMMPGAMCCDNQFPGVVCPPVYECPQVRCCHREIYHEVPHVIPVETRIINHHIYRHTYTPQYSCCEENEVCNIYDNKCGF